MYRNPATLKSADSIESVAKDGEWEKNQKEKKEKGSFKPTPPDNPQELFHKISESVRGVQLQDEVSEVSLKTIKLAEKLVSLKAPEEEDTLCSSLQTSFSK